LEELKNKGYFYGAQLYVFCISFHQQMATFALVIWLLLSLISFNSSNKVENRLLLLLPILYFTYFTGIIFYELTDFRFLETKLSFMAFPLIFFLNKYEVQEREKMFKILILGLVFSSILCLIFAFYNAIGVENGSVGFRANVLPEKGFMESILYGGNYFFGRYLSIFHQTVYFALYLCSGITILLFLPKLFETRTRRVLLVFLCAMIFLISNKASFIALGIIFLIRLFSLEASVAKKTLGILIAIAAFCFLFYTNPRARESIEKITKGELELKKNARYGFSTRLLSWDAAIYLIKENPFLGYGASNTQRRLNEVYQQKNYVFPLKESYNAHNLWMQIWLENGMFGLLALLILFFVLFRTSVIDARFMGLTLTLIAILFINSFFESIFNRFSGISFFSFIACFVLSMSKNVQDKI